MSGQCEVCSPHHPNDLDRIDARLGLVAPARPHDRIKRLLEQLHSPDPETSYSAHMDIYFLATFCLCHAGHQP